MVDEDQLKQRQDLVTCFVKLSQTKNLKNKQIYNIFHYKFCQVTSGNYQNNKYLCQFRSMFDKNDCDISRSKPRVLPNCPRFTDSPISRFQRRSRICSRNNRDQDPARSRKKKGKQTNNLFKRNWHWHDKMNQHFFLIRDNVSCSCDEMIYFFFLHRTRSESLPRTIGGTMYGTLPKSWRQQNLITQVSLLFKVQSDTKYPHMFQVQLRALLHNTAMDLTENKMPTVTKPLDLW